MRFDELVDELLQQNTVEENWKHKLAMGAAGLAAGFGLGAGALKSDTQKPMPPKQTETQRRIAAAEKLSKGEEPAPRYKTSDQSPAAKKYRENMKKIEAAERLSKGR